MRRHYQGGEHGAAGTEAGGGRRSLGAAAGALGPARGGAHASRHRRRGWPPGAALPCAGYAPADGAPSHYHSGHARGRREFRALFRLGALDPLRAIDLQQVPQSVRELHVSERQAEARKQIWRALSALGGIASPAGSCIWHVVGAEWSVKDWALREGWRGKSLKPDTASGFLVGALGVLQAHFGL